MSDPEARLALATLEHWASAGPILILGFGDQSVCEAAPVPATAFEQDLRAFRSIPGTSSCSVAFGPFLGTVLERIGQPATAFTSAVIRSPKTTDHLRMLLAMVRPVLDDGAPVVLIGHNDAGIRSAAKRVREFIGEPQVVDYRFHCRALLAHTTTPANGFDPGQWRSLFHEQLGPLTLAAVSYPGVFSHGEVDPGTRLLMASARIPKGARALDLGCGSGIVASWLAHQVDGKVHAVDVNALALHATHLTAMSNRVDDRVMVWGSDLFSDVAERYTHILSNAPFHQGVRTSTSVAHRLIAEAPDRLKAGGELWLVGNRFLDHAEQLTRAFPHVSVEAEDGRYRVWRARR